MKNLSLVILSAFLLTSCSLYNVTSEDFSEEVYPPKSSKDDVVFLENVTRPHKVIGEVTVNTERNQQSLRMEQIIDRLKTEAAFLGGDAVTNLRTNAGTGKWAKIKPKMLEHGNIRANFVADVIVFSAPAENATP